MSATPRLIFNWKDPANVAQWRREFEARRAQRKQPRSAYDDFVARSLDRVFTQEVDPHEFVMREGETLSERMWRLERGPHRTSKRTISQAKHMVPKFLARASGGGFVKHPMLSRVTEGKVQKAECMYDAGLICKAQREIACGILGGQVNCENGHEFLAPYACENRFCVGCGPRGANRLFARSVDPLRAVAQKLMRCLDPVCSECENAIKEKRLPHWPPPHGTRPRVVCAKIDFTVRYRKGMDFPAPDRMRELNDCIKRFFRKVERKYRIRRSEYGFAYCDELGANNDNPHAHGIYVGPWLPNGRKKTKERKEISELWEKTTSASSFRGSFIVSIKYADNFAEALYHAVKYPAKFAERSSPQRLAELECIFHRVRRFHTLASFYNPDVPKSEPEPKRCPLCGGRLTDWYIFEGLLELRSRGLRDIRDVQRECNDARANAPP